MSIDTPRDLVRSKPEDSGGWVPVQESWTDAPPSSRVRSTPPPLPASARVASAARDAADAAFADAMLGLLAAGDYAGALIAAEALLHVRPGDADALDCAEMSRSELRKTYVARLGGSLARVPHVAVGAAAIAALHLDFRGGFVLARVDGKATLEEIADGCLAPNDALRILSELALGRVIAFE